MAHGIRRCICLVSVAAACSVATLTPSADALPAQHHHAVSTRVSAFTASNPGTIPPDPGGPAKESARAHRFRVLAHRKGYSTKQINYIIKRHLMQVVPVIATHKRGRIALIPHISPVTAASATTYSSASKPKYLPRVCRIARQKVYEKDMVGKKLFSLYVPFGFCTRDNPATCTLIVVKMWSPQFMSQKIYPYVYKWMKFWHWDNLANYGVLGPEREVDGNVIAERTGKFHLNIGVGWLSIRSESYPYVKYYIDRQGYLGYAVGD